MSVTRRDVLAWVGRKGLALAALAEVGAAAKIGEEAFVFAKAAAFGDSSLALNPDQIQIGRRLLLGTGHRVKIIPATFNKISGEGTRTGITPPAKSAVDKLVRLFELASDHVATVRDLKTNNLRGNLCAVGGPIANVLSENLFGQGGHSPSMNHDGAPLRLPMFINNSLALEKMKMGESVLQGAKRSPIWRAQAGSRVYTPEIRKGKIAEDFLLVTNIPNIFDKESLEYHQRVVVVSGANGAGTRAVGNLLTSKFALDSLEKSASAVPRDGGWQALFHIPEVANNAPLRIGEILEFVNIDLDFSKVTKA